MGSAIMWVIEPFKLDVVWAGLCLVGAGYFSFTAIGAGTMFDGRRIVKSMANASPNSNP